jgi:excisionase family DNA binding protein
MSNSFKNVVSRVTHVVSMDASVATILARDVALMLYGDGGTITIPYPAATVPTERRARPEVVKRRLLTPEEVAEILGVSRAQAYRLIEAHLIHVAVGEKGKRVPLAALDAFINKRTEVPACQTDSTERKRGARGTARSTTSTGAAGRSASRPSTDEPPSTPSGGSKGKHTLRVVYPRTRRPTP